MKTKSHAIVVAAILAAMSFPKAEACTGISLKTKNGDVVMARTIEWSGSDMNAYYVVVPKGHTPTTLYAYTGVAVEMPQYIMEGINEKGLSAGLFYFPDYGRYQSDDEAKGKTQVADFELVGYVLSNCATIDEVKKAIKEIQIVSIDPRSSTVHWRFAQKDGKQIVLEMIDGRAVSTTTQWEY